MCLFFTTILFLLIGVERTKGHNEVMNTVDSLSGKELKVVIGAKAAAAQIFRNATGHVTGYGGVLYEQLSWLSLRLNFSLDMVPSIDNSFGILENGTWTGMRGQLQRGEVDLACAPFSGSAGYDVMELTVYVLGDAFGIFVKYPKPYIATDGPIKVFSLYVWIGLLFSMIACIGAIQLFTFLLRKYVDGYDQYLNISVSSAWLFVFGTLTNHCVSEGNVRSRNGSRSLGVITAAWCIVTFVFVNVYSSCMSSYMSLQFQRPDVATFDDLANNHNFLPTTIKGVTAEFIFLEAKSGQMRNIGDKLRHCTGGCSLSNYDTMIQNVLDGKFVAILPITSGTYYMTKTMTKHECKMTMGLESMAFLNMFMGVPKNSTYVMELNKESLWWHSLGLQKYWMQKLMPVPRQCLLQYNNKGESVKLVDGARLKLEQFTVAFIVLFVGYVLALIQFLRERFILRNCP